MAEALTVVGLVANVVQLVDLVSRILRRLEEYQSGARESPEVFRHVNTELPVLLNALQQTKAMIDSPAMQGETKRLLLPAIDSCEVQIRSLNDVIGKALPAPGDSWTRRSKKALGSFRYHGRVKKIMAVVRGYIQTLTYHAAASLLHLDQHPTSTSLA